jgi:hypothetical protein
MVSCGGAGAVGVKLKKSGREEGKSELLSVTFYESCKLTVEELVRLGQPNRLHLPQQKNHPLCFD